MVLWIDGYLQPINSFHQRYPSIKESVVRWKLFSIKNICVLQGSDHQVVSVLCLHFLVLHAHNDWSLNTNK